MGPWFARSGTRSDEAPIVSNLYLRINLAGIVAEVSDVQPSLSGSGKALRTLVLSDPYGVQVSIKRLGCGAEDLEIQPQQHIVLFFVSRRWVYHTTNVPPSAASPLQHASR